jgi:hypothetical protein
MPEKKEEWCLVFFKYQIILKKKKNLKIINLLFFKGKKSLKNI